MYSNAPVCTSGHLAVRYSEVGTSVLLQLNSSLIHSQPIKAYLDMVPVLVLGGTPTPYSTSTTPAYSYHNTGTRSIRYS